MIIIRNTSQFKTLRQTKENIMFEFSIKLQRVGEEVGGNDREGKNCTQLLRSITSR